MFIEFNECESALRFLKIVVSSQIPQDFGNCEQIVGVVYSANANVEDAHPEGQARSDLQERVLEGVVRAALPGYLENWRATQTTVDDNRNCAIV